MVEYNQWIPVLTNGGSLIVGILVGLWGPYFKKIWITPLFDINKLRQDIVTILHGTARVTLNRRLYNTRECEEIANQFSELSNRSEVIIRTFPHLDLYSRFKNIPNRDEMSKASGLFNRIVMRLRAPDEAVPNTAFENLEDKQEIERLWNVEFR